MKEEEIRDEKNTEVSDLEIAKKMIKIRQSAQDRKLDFNLKFETVKRLMSYNTCYYTSRVFGDEGSLYGRSFDRVDSSKGYVEDNVVACTIDINQKKANLSIEEIICLYDKLISYNKGGATKQMKDNNSLSKNKKIITESIEEN